MDKTRAFAVCVTVPTANRRCSAANGSHHPNHVHKRAGSTPPPHTHCPRSGMRVYRFGTHIIPMPRRGQKWTQNRPPVSNLSTMLSLHAATWFLCTSQQVVTPRPRMDPDRSTSILECSRVQTNVPRAQQHLKTSETEKPETRRT